MPNETMVYIYIGLGFLIGGGVYRIVHELMQIRKELARLYESQEQTRIESLKPRIRI